MRARWLVIVTVVGCLGLRAQAPVAADPLATLKFLEGTWSAHGVGPGGVAADGTYTFARELGGHVLVRHAQAAGCKGPAAFDCAHRDLLYVYPEGGALKAIFFDSEGHVIHYGVTVPAPETVELLSEAGPGPRFRLTYALKDGVMTGKFQMQPPGGTAWRSYLEWSGSPVAPVAGN